LYDDFLFVKTKTGANQFIESNEITKIGQRIEIPESAKKNYTEEELLKYLQNFQKK